MNDLLGQKIAFNNILKYIKYYTSVKTPKAETNIFITNKVERKGNLLSVALFSLALHKIPTKVSVRKIIPGSEQIITYADELMIVAKINRKLIRVLDERIIESKKMGLEIREANKKIIYVEKSIRTLNLLK